MNRLQKKQYIALFLLFGFFIQTAPVFAAPSQKTIEAERVLISSPTDKNASDYVKAVLKDYKKANRAKNYDEAADYLRCALYFLRSNPNSTAYKDTLSKLDTVLEKMGVDTSQENRLEIAKNLYLENKIFASAYEFSKLLQENYQIDICYEYLGDIAQKTGKNEAAYAFYKKAAEVNPENLDAKYKYANALLSRGKINDALYYFEEVIEETNSKTVINEIITTFTDRVSKDPDNENNYGILGLAYQKIGQYDKTYKLLKKSLILNPDDVFLRYQLGNLLYNINEFSFANEIYSEILEENPYESQIRLSRAKAYSKLKDEKKAINDYQVVLAMYPDSIQAQYGMYTLLKNKYTLEKIINLYYPLEPDYKLNYEGYNDLGYLANKLGKTEDALVFFEKSAVLNPKSEISYIELYKAYQVLGQNEKARAILEKAYKLFPKNSEILDMYSALNSDKVDEKNSIALNYLNEGEYQKAIAVYKQIEPKTGATYAAIGNCYRQLGDLKNAVNYYKKASAIEPNNSETYYALGVTYIEANDIKKAKEAFSLSLQKNPKNVKSKKMLSYIEQKEVVKSLDLAYDFYERKDYPAALRYLNKAVETFPNDPKVYYYRGLTKEAVGDYKGAISDFKQTIDIDRNYVSAYFKLAENLEKTGKKKEALFMYEKYLGAENLDSSLAKQAQQRVLELGERYY